jgi:RimJ/RimL family protein N-acetyltransferase
MVTFRPLARADLPRLRDWLNEPHVAAWWGAGTGPDGLGGAGVDAATLEQVEAAYGDAIAGRGATRHFVIVVDGAPVGLIQSYRLGDEPEYAAEIGELEGAGVDLLIGDADRTGHGLGSEVIDAFVTHVVFQEAGVERCVAGPDVRNARSIGAFRRAGFRWVRDAAVAGEPAPEHVMVRDRAPGGRVRRSPPSAG